VTQVFTFPAHPIRSAWPLVVVASHAITPRMRRVSLIGESLAGFAHRPGQSLVLGLRQAGGGLARRHYAIRRFDREELRLDLDLVTHGASPGVRWAQSARIGDPVLAEGPHGRIAVNPRADWHLFAGDESALPAIAAMLEALPARTHAYALIEVAGPEEEQPLDTAAELEALWVHRQVPPGAASAELVDQTAAFKPPAGVGQVYLLGETATVRAQREALFARGFPSARILAEGYWRPGRAGGRDRIGRLERREHRRRIRGWAHAYA
jgi:NADPH-dependent ferric siderophore reductase